MDTTLTATVAEASAALGGPGELVGSADSPRFELFHAANSICSQKVRVVLAHHALAYVSHPMDLFRGQTYLPGYVRLRMLGCAAFGGALVARHDGSTSASAGGCDGAVVPTLVDRANDQVVVDSKRICLHLDAQASADERLRPAPLAAAIDEQLAIVDNIPNYQMLMARSLNASDTAEARAAVAGSFSQRKVAWCDTYLAEHADDPVLTAAYTAKRAKEASAAADLFSAEALRIAYDRAEAAVEGLEARLASAEGAWLFGDAPTMADLFWGVELLRMGNVGFAPAWEGGRCPHVERFVARAAASRAIRSAILDWPGAMY